MYDPKTKRANVEVLTYEEAQNWCGEKVKNWIFTQSQFIFTV